nr:tautomerase family protein [uncultured Holophaga sp.]
MPVIQVAIQSLPPETKKSLISSLTATAAQVTGIPEAKFIVFIAEHPADAIGIGGRTLQELKAEAPH